MAIVRPDAVFFSDPGGMAHALWQIIMHMQPRQYDGAVANRFYMCDSPFTVGLPSMPSPAGKGDREAVDEENILWQL